MPSLRLTAWLVLLNTCGVASRAASPIYAATNYGLFKSTNAGAAWTTLKIPLTNSLLSGTAMGRTLVLDPVNPAKIYMVGYAGVHAFFSSPDAGQTWTATPIIAFTPLESADPIAIDRAGQVIYLIGDTTSCLTDCFLYRTMDAGATWTRLVLPNTTTAPVNRYPKGPAVYHVIADVTTSGIVYASDGSDFFKSVDFGNTWTLISTGFGFPAQAVSRIVLDPHNSQTFYALNSVTPNGVPCPLTNGGQCGVFKSVDGGVTWTGLPIPAGLVINLSVGATGALYASAVSPGIGGSILKSTDGGATWTPLKNGFSFSTNGEGGVWTDPSNASAVYIVDPQQPTPFYSSSDAGASFTRYPVTPPGCSNCSTGVNVSAFAVGAPVSGTGGGFSCTNSAAPLITFVDSASSYGGYPYFASGSWLEIKGSNLADSADPRLTASVNPGQWAAGDFSGVNAPTSLDGVAVSINNKPAYVWYLSPTQINVQAPEDSTTGNVAITVTNCNATSPAFTLARKPLAPGLLAPPTYSAGGTQYLVATFASDNAYVLNTGTGASFGLTSRPAKPGDVIIAYGIGFGDVNPSILPGVMAEQSNALVNPVTFAFGSTNATTAYAGLAGNFVGLYEFYITVPPGLANGDYQINVAQNGTKLPQTLYLTVHN